MRYVREFQLKKNGIIITHKVIISILNDFPRSREHNFESGDFLLEFTRSKSFFVNEKKRKKTGTCRLSKMLQSANNMPWYVEA